MSFETVSFILGPVENNTYLVFDSQTHEAVVIDPSFDIDILLDYARDPQINITQIWLTHAHYDHFAGVDGLLAAYPNLKIGLHPADRPLLDSGGMSSIMGINATISFIPDLIFTDQMELKLGDNKFVVLHTPGHSPGHVVFYNSASAVVFCGDLIFNQGIGRVDFPGGSAKEIIKSIRNKIMVLPPDTILYSGHGPQTTVGMEANQNPFL
jgi:hydroxyacylglutathione hydrolase